MVSYGTIPFVNSAEETKTEENAVSLDEETKPQVYLRDLIPYNMRYMKRKFWRDNLGKSKLELAVDEANRKSLKKDEEMV